MDPLPELVARLRAAGCVFAEDEAALLLAAAADAVELELLAERRVAGHPLEHLLGWAEFCGRRILVGPGVFVPRLRTGLLARLAIGIATPLPRPVAVDLCCGSGAVAVVVSGEVPTAEVHAVDIDPAATGFAGRNLSGRGQVWQGDLFEPLPRWLRGRIDVVTANAPYVPTGDIRLMPLEARGHESLVSLDGGVDGLDLQRRVTAGAPDWLTASGTLLVETSRTQAPATLGLFEEAGFDARIEVDDDIAATVVVGTLR